MALSHLVPVAAFGECTVEPRRIAVFRALMLGDLICATPALRAMRAAWPRAHITLVGLPWSEEWASRLPWIDDVECFPGWPGLPEGGSPTEAAMRQFVDRMRARDVDLAVQLHGSGEVTNALVASFGARWNAGFFTTASGHPPGEAQRFVEWPTEGHEIERLLAVTDRLGAPRRGLALDWSLTPQDLSNARAMLAFDGPFAVVHPGAQLPSRRWMPERFVAVAERLAQQGLRVVLTGSPGEADLTRAIAQRVQAHGAVVDLAGRTDLWTFGGLVASADVLVCNDTGPSHIAAAVGTPSVVVACGSEVTRWAPLDRERHRVLWHDLVCRPCGHRVCPTAHECARAIEVEHVLATVSNVMNQESPHATIAIP